MPEQKLHSALPAGYGSRAIRMDDVTEVANLLNDYLEAAMGMRKFTEDDLRSQAGVPGFDLEGSTRVVLSPQGRIIGCMIVTDIASPPVHPNALGCVQRDFERRGIGTYLLQWAVERGKQAIARVPEGLRVSMYFSAPGGHEPTTRLFEKAGLEVIRYSWLMLIDLDQPPPEPQWPQGIVVHTYSEYSDLRAVYRAVDDSFQDHWGYVQRSEEEALPRWEYRIKNDKMFEPTLWFLAMQGEEIAGVALCRPQSGENPPMAFVDTLGVRRPWRCQGLGLALLHHVFGEFYRRGQKLVGLGVDANSLTGATRLYEKAGMRVAQQVTAYEIELRPGRELGRQSLD